MSNISSFVLILNVAVIALMAISIDGKLTRLADIQSRAVQVQEQMLARQAVMDSIVWGIKP